MCSCDSYKFYYDHCVTDSNDQLCRKSILFFSRWSSGSDTNRYSRRNLFIHCRTNDRCSNWCHHTETSTAGTYTVTYTMAAAGGCAAQTATTSVTITALPAATISYAGTPFCSSLVGAQSVTQTGTAGGAYSSTVGLTINTATGAITRDKYSRNLYSY